MRRSVRYTSRSVLFEDPEGLAKQAVMREGSDETLRSILRVLRKKLVRLPSGRSSP